MPVEGHWVDRVVGLDDVRVDIAIMRTPDGRGRSGFESHGARHNREFVDHDVAEAFCPGAHFSLRSDPLPLGLASRLTRSVVGTLR